MGKTSLGKGRIKRPFLYVVNDFPAGSRLQRIHLDSATFTVSFVATTADGDALAAIAAGEPVLEDYLSDPANAALDFMFGV